METIPNLTFKGFSRYTDIQACCHPVHFYLQHNALSHNHSAFLDIKPRNGTPFQIRIMRKKGAFIVTHSAAQGHILPDITFTKFNNTPAIEGTCMRIWDYTKKYKPQDNHTLTMQTWPRGWYPFEIAIYYTENGNITAEFLRSVTTYEFKNPTV